MLNDPLKTLTDRLIAKSDKELRDEIKKAVEPLDELLRDGSCWEVTFPVHHNGAEFTVAIRWYEVLEALKEAAFNRNKNHRQQLEIDSFFSRVEKLEQECAELTNAVNAEQ